MRVTGALYGVFGYAAFVVTFVYAVGFIADWWWQRRSIARNGLRAALRPLLTFSCFSFSRYRIAAVGTMLEERDLVRWFGDTYRDYRRRVPAIVPSFRQRR